MEFNTGARLVPYLDDFLTFAVIHITASQMFDCSQESGVRVRRRSQEAESESGVKVRSRSQFDTGARLVPYLYYSLTRAVIYITASQMLRRSQESESGVGVRRRSQESESGAGVRLVPYLDDFVTCAVIDITASQMFDRSQESESGAGIRSQSQESARQVIQMSGLGVFVLPRVFHFNAQNLVKIFCSFLRPCRLKSKGMFQKT